MSVGWSGAARSLVDRSMVREGLPNERACMHAHARRRDYASRSSGRPPCQPCQRSIAIRAVTRGEVRWL